MDISLCNPCGAFEATISLMMRKFHIDHYTEKIDTSAEKNQKNKGLNNIANNNLISDRSGFINNHLDDSVSI